MLLKISENEKNKKIKLSDALELMLKIKGLIYRVSVMFCATDYENANCPFTLIDYYYDIEDIAQLYSLIMKKLLKLMSYEKINEDMSLLEYFMLYELDNKYALGCLDGIYGFMEAKNNNGVDFLEEKKEGLLIVDERVKNIIFEYESFLNEFNSFSKKYISRKNSLNEKYNAIIDKEIVFWDVLDMWNREKWQIYNEEKVEFLSGTGEVIECF